MWYAICLDNNLSWCLNTTALSNIIDIWHLRLGHLFGERLCIMKRQYPFIDSISNLVCKTCHLAKQRKFSFNSSSSQIECKFNLIYVLTFLWTIIDFFSFTTTPILLGYLFRKINLKLGIAWLISLHMLWLSIIKLLNAFSLTMA